MTITTHHGKDEIHTQILSFSSFFLNSHGDGLSGAGAKASAYMYLFRNSSYVDSYPGGPVTLPVGSVLYVGVSVAESDSAFAVIMEDCYSTPSSNPDDPMQYFVIHSRYAALLIHTDWNVKKSNLW